MDTPYSSSFDFIKPHTKPLDCCVYLLPQCRRCVKRGLNFCFVIVIGMLAVLAVSSVRNNYFLLYCCRGDGEKKGGERRRSKARE